MLRFKGSWKGADASHCTRRVLEKLALGGKLLVALVGASVVGEQMWENDLPSLPCLLESN